MATGLPAVVSDRVGCAPDLVVPGETGEIHRAGDAGDLRLALERVRDRGARCAMARACRNRVARCDYAAAATGLVAACQSLTADDTARVIACCGDMVIVSGLERMTFEVLRVVRDSGGAVHCVVNSWENERIVALAERIGASWSTGFYWYNFNSRPRMPLQAVQMLWDVLRTSGGLLRVSARFRPTHALTPEHIAVLRNAPALTLLRLLGVTVVARLAMAPERGRVQHWLWGYALSPFVSRFIAISRFCADRMIEEGIDRRKVTIIRNSLSRRPALASVDEDVMALVRRRPTLLTVGQVAPFKGTHLAVEATLQLLDEGADVQAVILGALPTWPASAVEYVAALRRRIDEKGATDRVHFVGVRENVLELMKSSYVLSAPILCEEAFCNVVHEARSVGLPVVTFPNGALPELVEHERTGYLCEPSDLTGLLTGLRHFLRSRQARDEASAHSLRVTMSPDNDCTPLEFSRRWRHIFEPSSRASGVTINEDLVSQ
jgi:glycosyltransferase involved in cell wall biosynthesis